MIDTESNVALRENGSQLPVLRRVGVLVVDDHPVVRAGVVSLIEAHERLCVLGQAVDGAEGLAKAKELAPEIVVTDIGLPKLSGLALTQKLRSEMPAVKVVLLSMHDPEKVATAVLRSGARGYVCKGAATSELLNALETVHNGGTYFGSGFGRTLFNRAAAEAQKPSRRELSARERDVLIAIADGLSNKEVANRLDLGVRTVETHRDSIMRKLNIRSVAGLTIYAIQKGLVSL